MLYLVGKNIAGFRADAQIQVDPTAQLQVLIAQLGEDKVLAMLIIRLVDYKHLHSVWKRLPIGTEK